MCPALKGKTVYYVPLVAAIPGFAATAVALKGSLAKAGLKLQVCDGQGNPSAIAACVGQATGAGAAGIILDAAPYGMAENALNSAKAKGIPIIIADQYPPAANTVNTDAVTYVPGVVDQPSQIAWWTIADSKGAANAIIAQEVDSPSSKQYVTNSLSIYSQYCPGCKITLKTITASTNSLLASATSANILANPNATYYYTEFEDSLQPTIQGIQQSAQDEHLAVGRGRLDRWPRAAQERLLGRQGRRHGGRGVRRVGADRRDPADGDEERAGGGDVRFAAFHHPEHRYHPGHARGRELGCLVRRHLLPERVRAALGRLTEK